MCDMWWNCIAQTKKLPLPLLALLPARVLTPHYLQWTWVLWMGNIWVSHWLPAAANRDGNHWQQWWAGGLGKSRQSLEVVTPTPSRFCLYSYCMCARRTLTYLVHRGRLYIAVGNAGRQSAPVKISSQGHLCASHKKAETSEQAEEGWREARGRKKGVGMETLITLPLVLSFFLFFFYPHCDTGRHC